MVIQLLIVQSGSPIVWSTAFEIFGLIFRKRMQFELCAETSIVVCWLEQVLRLRRDATCCRGFLPTRQPSRLISGTLQIHESALGTCREIFFGIRTRHVYFQDSLRRKSLRQHWKIAWRWVGGKGCAAVHTSERANGNLAFIRSSVIAYYTAHMKGG